MSVQTLVPLGHYFTLALNCYRLNTICSANHIFRHFAQNANAYFSDKDYWELRMVDVQRLDVALRDSYDHWVSQAPPGWFVDEFFRNSSPMIVTCKYGQDQPICIPGQRHLERDRWESERDYTKMRYVTISLASHIT